jgi:hypothetical protein
MNQKMDEFLWNDVAWLPEDLTAKWILGVKAQHEKNGWRSLPGILWDVDTMTYIGTQHGLRRMLEIATKTWRPSKAREYRTYLTSIILSVESLGVDFCGWGAAYPSAREQALGVLKDFLFNNKTRLLDVYAPTWRQLNQDARFRSTFGPQRSSSGGMFNIGGTPRSAAYVAQQLHMTFVVDTAKNFFKPSDIHLPESKVALFHSKIYLYCEAAVLRVLLTEEQQNESYRELVTEFEKLILPPPSQGGMTKLEAIKAAMKSHDQLFTEKKEFTWTRNWLKGIGHEETNPEALATFAQLIGLNTRTVRKFIHDIGPPSTR